MSRLQERLRDRARAESHRLGCPAEQLEEWRGADALDALQVALEEARDALNGAPNTVGLHNQIAHALANLES